MPQIEVRRADNQVDTLTLSKAQPVSIGRHSTCDVRIDEEGVGVLHCRISWNREAFEVTSAQPDGVDLNGLFVRHQLLIDGDVIRVGSVDIVARLNGEPEPSRGSRRIALADLERDAAPEPGAESEIEFAAIETSPAPAAPGDDVGLAPISEDEMLVPKRPGEGLSARLLDPSKSPAPTAAPRDSGVRDSRRTPPPSPPPREKDPGGSGVRTLPKLPPAKSDRSSIAKRPAPPPEESDEPSIVDEAILSAEEIVSADEIEPKDEWLPRTAKSLARDDSKAKPAPPVQRRAFTPRRPGERDPIRSPLTLSLAGGTAALVLAGLVVWFLIGRAAVRREYDAALDDLNQGRYAQAVERFEAFLDSYPRHAYSQPARVALGKAKIERETAGSAPSWPRGLQALQAFIDAHRDDEDFNDLERDISRYAERIALGAAKSAETTRRKDPLATTGEATKLFARFAGSEKNVTSRQKQIEIAVASAESAIARQESFDAALAGMDASLTAKRPMLALDARRQLLDRYPAFASNPQLTALLDRALVAEKSLVVREELSRDAARGEPATDLPQPVTLAPHPRSRTDDVSDGRTVFAVAKDCLFGIDAVTGDPLWRRVVGLGSSFFPRPVSTSVEGVLAFDARRNELVLLERRTGRLIWRQPLGAPATGEPALHDGQAYLPTADGSVFQIDLETGRATARLRVSQPLRAPPAFVDGDRLVLAGDAEMLYTLRLRPLSCESVTHLGHRTGTIVAPLTPMGTLLLVAENDRQQSARLRALDASPGGAWLAERASVRVEGQVRDPPAIRGKELFIPSTDERITAFVVSDARGQAPLSQAARFQITNPQPVPMSFSIGAEGSLWLASSALRRLQLKAESIKVEGPPIAEGIATQPVQLLGNTLFVGRRQPFSEAVLFTQADREQMTNPWRTVLGGSPLASLSTGDGLVTVTEQGDVFRLQKRDLESGGFRVDPSASLKLSEKLAQPLRAWPLGSDRIAVAAGGTEPSLWVVNRTGQIERELRLDASPEANPVLLAAGLVVPLPGRLRLLPPTGGAKGEDYLMPLEKNETATWKHLVRIDDAQLAAIDSRGRVARIQHRTTPLVHLAEVADLALNQPVDVPPALARNRLLIADASGKLQAFDAATFEPRGSLRLDAPATGTIHVAAGRAFVETGRRKVAAISIDDPLKAIWTVDVPEGLAGPPAPSGHRLVIPGRTGELIVVQPDTGGTIATVSIGQPLAGGPIAVGDSLAVPTIDGSFTPVETAVQK